MSSASRRVRMRCSDADKPFRQHTGKRYQLGFGGTQNAFLKRRGRVSALRAVFADGVVFQHTEQPLDRLLVLHHAVYLCQQDEKGVGYNVLGNIAAADNGQTVCTIIL